MPLELADVTAIANALQGINQHPAPAINSVSVKLPPFWVDNPEIWFVQVEAQFETRNITADKTKFNYVVSALENSTAAEVEALLLNPPAANLYPALKTALIEAFGKSQVTKDNELLSLSGLGDRKPSALLRYIKSLNSNPETLLRAIFISHLPTEVRQILASSSTDNLDEMAKEADRILEAKGNQNQVSSIKNSSFKKSDTSSKGVLCFFHKKFGKNARKCKGGDCSLKALIDNSTENSGNEQAGR